MCDILPAEEIPGWGQINDYVIDDAVVWARRQLKCGGPEAAFCLLPELKRLLPTWRGPAAADLIFKIERGLYLPRSKDTLLQSEPLREGELAGISEELQRIPSGQ